jgi:hypothetical protein
MKLFKSLKYNTLLFAGLSIVMFGCLEEQWDAADGGKSVGANLHPPTLISYLLGQTTEITFDLNAFESEAGVIESVAWTKVFTHAGETATATGTITGGHTFSQTTAEFLGDVPIGGTVVDESELVAGVSGWTISYVITVKGQTHTIGDQTTVQFSCPSTLEGTFDVSTVGWCGTTISGGVLTWIADGDGLYHVDGGDFSYGAYDACYGDGATFGSAGFYPEGTLQVKDVCNAIWPIGASQWGEIYTFNSVTTSGTSLTIDWVNDYGEGGVSTLVRQDGTDWPPLKVGP